MEKTPLLQIRDLSLSFCMYETSSTNFFSSEKTDVSIVEGFDLSIYKGEVVAILGASGSGKTLLADSILGMFDYNETAVGEVLFKGKPVTAKELAALRGSEIALVPQSVKSLDPVMRVGKQVLGVCASKEEKTNRKKRQEALFEKYGLSTDVEKMYPHELSGGMARRVLLCCALMENPELIVADEPTPGLDRSLALQAMDDLKGVAQEGGAVILITHDIELALGAADRIIVLRAGEIVEETTPQRFADPNIEHHEFTKSIWEAMPEHGFHENMEQEKVSSNA